MIPQISSALSNGFTTKQVIDFLLKKFPQHSEKIKSAMAAGFTTDQVIKFLSGGKKEMSEESSNQTEHEQARGVYTKQRENVNKAGVAVAGLGATALAAPMAAQALKRAIPQNLLGSIPQPSQQEQAISPEIIASQTQQPPVSQPNITQPQQPIQPEVKTIDVGGLLDKSGLKKHVDDLSKRIKDPKQIAAVLYSKYPDEMKAFQKESGKNMEDAIGDYLSTNPVQSGAIPAQSPQNPVGNEMKPTEATPIAEQTKPAKIEKSSIVASPNGIGEVKEIRNGNALIDVDGKLHKVKEEELIQSPLPEKELADLFDELVGGIEKKHGEISKNVYWAGYDPNTNELAYIPHDGGLYVYADISPEDSKELTSMLTLRKTTGQNYLGTWTKDTPSPIGAPMSKLIKKLQSERGGKGNEYSNKFLKIYDALEPAKSAAKKKHEEQRKKKAKKPRID